MPGKQPKSSTGPKSRLLLKVLESVGVGSSNQAPLLIRRGLLMKISDVWRP